MVAIGHSTPAGGSSPSQADGWAPPEHDWTPVPASGWSLSANGGPPGIGYSPIDGYPGEDLLAEPETVDEADGEGEPPGPPWPGVGTQTLRERARETGPRANGYRFLELHELMLVTVGHGVCSIDFLSYPCRPGTLVWAQPGQVIRAAQQPGLDAILVSWEHALLDELGLPEQPAGLRYWQLAGEDEDAVINEVTQLVVDCQRHLSGDLPAAILRHQAAVLVLRLAGLGGTEPTTLTPAERATYRRFASEVERHHASSRRVEDYAATLGCSVRTLTRACLSATGRSAKQVIDDRVALQAKRLLAATDLPVATVGAQLGFPEPTNFGRFFHREVGVSPGSFRARPSEHAGVTLQQWRPVAR